MAVSHALVVKIDAKPDRAEAVATFLAGAQPLAEAEPGTVSWYGRPCSRPCPLGDPILTGDLSIGAIITRPAH